MVKALVFSAAMAIAAPAVASESAITRSVDLDAPGALEILARDRPLHFAKIRRILREAPHWPLAEVQGWIRVRFEASAVAAPFLLRTSYPAQARLSFVLDDTRYVAIIRLGKINPDLIPAK